MPLNWKKIIVEDFLKIMHSLCPPFATASWRLFLLPYIVLDVKEAPRGFKARRWQIETTLQYPWYRGMPSCRPCRYKLIKWLCYCRLRLLRAATPAKAPRPPGSVARAPTADTPALPLSARADVSPLPMKFPEPPSQRLLQDLDVS